MKKVQFPVSASLGMVKSIACVCVMFTGNMYVQFD